MTKTVEMINNAVKELMSSRKIEQLVEDFEATETLEMSEELPTVRGWIMDELERRDETAFVTWIDSNESSPRNYYL